MQTGWRRIIATDSCLLDRYSLSPYYSKEYFYKLKAFYRSSVSQIIMNNAVVASDERVLKVFRGTEELVSGSVYHHSESLTVSISDTHDQFLFEAIGGAKFEKGGCEGKRIADKKQAVLKMPLSGEDEIKIVAGSLSADFFHGDTIPLN